MPTGESKVAVGRYVTPLSGLGAMPRDDQKVYLEDGIMRCPKCGQEMDREVIDEDFDWCGEHSMSECAAGAPTYDICRYTCSKCGCTEETREGPIS